MNIPFRRIGTSPQSVSVRSEDAELSGTLEQFGRSLVLFKGRLTGTLRVNCDLCAAAFDSVLDEEISFLISEGIYEGENEEYDVVETEESVINMDEILHSELELIRSDYHRCENC
jgi:hypothetical protein